MIKRKTFITSYSQTLYMVSFKAPEQYLTFNRGKTKCDCECQTATLPRNAILFRLYRKDSAEDYYNILVDLWRRGFFKQLSHGTCQELIKVQDLKNLRLFKTQVRCLDNIDRKLLKTGDILLSRIGSKRSIGKPHLITNVEG